MRGLYKHEAVAKEASIRAGALRAITDALDFTVGWVHWYDDESLHSAL